MIHILGIIPSKVAIAVSGGADSMAVLDFLRRSREVIVLHYNHGTGHHADAAEDVVRNYCNSFNIQCVVGYNRDEMPKGVSSQAWWRSKRYTWFESVIDLPVITAHHLSDVVENWIFTSLNGNPFLMSSARGNYLRPFLTTEKSDFMDWCERKDVPFVEDITNVDIKYRRNYIRHVMMPHVEHINPGIRKIIKKKIVKNVKVPARYGII